METQKQVMAAMPTKKKKHGTSMAEIPKGAGVETVTENDIIRALECCANWDGVWSCANCPLYDTGCIHFDELKETLNLIKRQKAEIERLTKEGLEINKIFMGFVKEKNSEAIIEFAERLKKLLNFYYPKQRSVHTHIDNLVKKMTKQE